MIKRVKSVCICTFYSMTSLRQGSWNGQTSAGALLYTAGSTSTQAYLFSCYLVEKSVMSLKPKHLGSSRFTACKHWVWFIHVARGSRNGTRQNGSRVPLEALNLKTFDAPTTGIVTVFEHAPHRKCVTVEYFFRAEGGIEE